MKDPMAYPINRMTAAFRAAHIIATQGGDVGEFDGSLEGKVVRQEDGDTVTFTPDCWLIWVSNGAATFGSRVQATPALLAELRKRST